MVFVRASEDILKSTMKANAFFSDLLTFIDTAGQEQYQEHRKEAIEAGHGYLMVYDITQR